MKYRYKIFRSIFESFPFDIEPLYKLCMICCFLMENIDLLKILVILIVLFYVLSVLLYVTDYTNASSELE